MSMELYLLTQRDDIASPQHAGIFELENIFVETCDAKLLSSKSRSLVRRIDTARYYLPAKSFLKQNFIRRTIGLQEFVNIPPRSKSNTTRVLIIIGLGPSKINLLKSIRNWRKEFDIVAAFIHDAWLLNSYPRITRMIDYLFVPAQELVDVLSAHLFINISFLPYGADVIRYGSNNTYRSIDVSSYGRIPSEYHLHLFKTLNIDRENNFYYRQVPEKTQHYPDTLFNSSRFDYQHRKLLSKVLINTKVSMAFDFESTRSTKVELENSQKHPSNRYSKSVLTARWFEGWAAGCAIVGKRPLVPEFDELIDWEDAAIDVPDDLECGIEMIMDLIKDEDRLRSIHCRNYREMLKRHDYRWRIKAIFDKLDLPLPGKLTAQLENLTELVAKS